MPPAEPRGRSTPLLVAGHRPALRVRLHERTMCYNDMLKEFQMSPPRRSAPVPDPLAVRDWLLELLAVVAILVAAAACGGSSSPAEPEPPPEGAVFRVAVLHETFHILLQDPERIAEAETLLAEGPRKTVAGRLARGDGGFNQPWSWHLIPDTVQFAEVCAEIYDGGPSGIEAGLDRWIDEVMFFCPWNGELVARVR